MFGDVSGCQANKSSAFLTLFTPFTDKSSPPLKGVSGGSKADIPKGMFLRCVLWTQATNKSSLPRGAINIRVYQKCQRSKPLLKVCLFLRRLEVLTKQTFGLLRRC